MNITKILWRYSNRPTKYRIDETLLNRILRKTLRLCTIHKPFKGTFLYEWQIGFLYIGFWHQIYDWHHYGDHDLKKEGDKNKQVRLSKVMDSACNATCIWRESELYSIPFYKALLHPHIRLIDLNTDKWWTLK